MLGKWWETIKHTISPHTRDDEVESDTDTESDATATVSVGDQDVDIVETDDGFVCRAEGNGSYPTVPGGFDEINGGYASYDVIDGYEIKRDVYLLVDEDEDAWIVSEASMDADTPGPVFTDEFRDLSAIQHALDWYADQYL